MNKRNRARDAVKPGEREVRVDATTTEAAAIRPAFSGLWIVHARRHASYRCHQHLDYQVVVVEQGVYHCRLNKNPLRLRTGQVLIVKPGDWHEDACSPPLRYSTLNFRLWGNSPSKRSQSLFVEETRAEQQVLDPPKGRFVPLMREMEREARVEDHASAMVLDALLRQFFWRMVRYLPREVISPRFVAQSHRQAFVARLRRLFQNHLHTQLTVVQLAGEMGISPRALSYHCRDALGDSPARAFTRYKIEHAAQLLADTALSVKEASAALGFANQFHFSRVFKSHMGFPPSKTHP